MSEADAATPPLGMPVARPRWRTLVVGLVIGLAVGGGGVGLAWVIADQKPSDAAADAEATCALVRRAGQPEPGKNFAEYGRWISAGALAKVAADSDPQYQPLADTLFEVSRIVARTYEAKGPDFEREVRKVREFCDNL